MKLYLCHLDFKEGLCKNINSLFYPNKSFISIFLAFIFFNPNVVCGSHTTRLLLLTEKSFIY